MREGKPVTVDVINDTDTPEFVHWHGMLIPPEVDGTGEEGSPLVPPHGQRRFQLTPGPAGTRWYHSHAMAMDDLHKGSYTGQFGFVYVDGGNDPGHYDQELFLALRDWEPFFTATMEDDDDDTHNGPLLEKPPVLNTDPNGLEVGSMTYSINDKALGSGEPIRVREGQRLLIRFLNASAIENRRIALPGHKMKVIALDGNPVPTPQALDSIFLGTGERVDVVIEMNHPGIWILGSTEKMVRESGLGVVVEYAGQHRQPQWIDPPKVPWDYTIFGTPTSNAPAPQQTIEMVFEKIPRGAGKFNSWLINGKAIPPRPGVRAATGHALPTRHAQPYRRRPPHALAPASLGTGRDQREEDRRHHQGHRSRPLLRPRHRRLHRQPARPLSLPLPHPATHGLRLQSTLPLRLT